MIYILIAFGILTLYGIRYNKGGYYDDYISKTQCNAIKGIFILVVFIRHSLQYINQVGYNYNSWGDSFFKAVDFYWKHLLVAMFLFYSGYGVMESIKHKGDIYIRSIPKKRLLTTLLNFDVAVLCYIVLDIIISRDITFQQALLSMFAWDSVGNSNWYIFCILLCYLATYLSFYIAKKLGLSSSFAVWNICTILFLMLIGMSFVKPFYWYCTMIVYGAGCLFSYYQKDLEKYVQRRYFSILVATAIVFGLLYYAPLNYMTARDNITAIVFALLVVIITMKIKIGNKWLLWMGINLFPLYIYQRLPMIALTKYNEGIFVLNNPSAFMIICFVISIIITYFYKYWQIKLR